MRMVVVRGTMVACGSGSPVEIQAPPNGRNPSRRYSEARLAAAACPPSVPEARPSKASLSPDRRDGPGAQAPTIGPEPGPPRSPPHIESDRLAQGQVREHAGHEPCLQ